MSLSRYLVQNQPREKIPLIRLSPPQTHRPPGNHPVSYTHLHQDAARFEHLSRCLDGGKAGLMAGGHRLVAVGQVPQVEHPPIDGARHKFLHPAVAGVDEGVILPGTPLF